jgi:hypothetical protein
MQRLANQLMPVVATLEDLDETSLASPGSWPRRRGNWPRLNMFRFREDV